MADARALAQSLASALWHDEVDVAVFPPFVHLSATLDTLRASPVAVGAQDSSEFPAGAYTGEVTAEMLADLGCGFVLIGHSERRTLLREDDRLIGRKLSKALACGLKPILCVGETAEERDQSRAEEVVLGQLNSIWKHLGADGLSRLTIAYEPVWAIGTGRSASPQEADEVHHWIRNWLVQRLGLPARNLRIIYGGSVNRTNAAQLFACKNIDGALVGGASLKPDEFYEIHLHAAASRLR
ncbi:MAG: triose-phosphate isomerase [Zoogloeaceae bacterium]|nr:triose-phosphate isomerase [Zoogloeaceae bacterium]